MVTKNTNIEVCGTLRVKKYYLVAAIFTNIHTCLKGSQVSTFFDCSPPILEEYMNG